MKLNRSLIKQQAKELIKGSVFSLFLITAVVGICTGGLSIGSRMTFDTDDLKGLFNSGSNSYSEGFYFGGDDMFDDGFDEFFEQAMPQQQQNRNMLRTVGVMLSGVIGAILGLAQFFLAPLSITVLGIYVMLVHGNKMKIEDHFKYTFTKTFDSTYWKKLVLYLVENIIISLMAILFIIPGIIFYYRYYFANMIMADNPNLSAKQAVKLSIKMTEGHKGELFALDLSFIGWLFLVPITLGLVSIYTLPYYATTKTLYYENFKGRALAEGVLTQEDFEKNTFDTPTQSFDQATNKGEYINPVMPSQPVVEVKEEQAPVYSAPVKPVVEEAPSYYEPIITHTPAVEEEPTSPVALPVEEPAVEQKDDFGTSNTTNYYNGMF